ncbi:endonuclease V [Flavobacterium sp.]|uniref:endonuclease V n=1 Tax=Flavobacterium sp. TaxID=239 RepID=UPI002FDCE6DC
MLLAIDVHYKEKYSKAVGVFFNWEDEIPKEIETTIIDEFAEYESGQFYKRELPCILQLLEKIDLKKVECIIVDGHVYINNNKTFGLGGHLYHSLNEKIPIIGVAKKSFVNTDKVSFPIFRGESKMPLYISSIGIEINSALEKIKKMKGKYRIPTILQILDTETKKD